MHSMEGNALGFAVGQPTFATALKGGDTPYDGNYASSCITTSR